MEPKNKKLSAMEDTILKLVADGDGTKQIAEMLKISPRTVDTHRHRIMLKLGAVSMINAVGIYARKGLLQ